MPPQAPVVLIREVPCIREMIAQTPDGPVVVNVPRSGHQDWKKAQSDLFIWRR
ncbi:hypothetical protein [Pseudanabaena sp. FACHB-2040]|uniref:hypothetical protein n=1 Tax=Pseudanabaena sp. FACHB-2040 TaxID=2692859 RepID=UPI001689547C|nr:hypothetical protein [Pseudanabaena sp. FACHB-2040]MBD2261380.1 hypothetical protein [Pseudanabaena sp. FACHB-2040]